MKTIAEQIADLEATRAAKAARMQEVINKSLAEGRSTDDEEGAEFDALEVELKRVDADLVRMRRMEQMNLSKAKPIDGSSSGAGTASRGPTVFARSSDVEEKFKGQNFVRKIIAKACARIEGKHVAQVATERWGQTNPALVNIIKANEVAGGGTGAGEWGSELASIDGRYTGDFIEFLYGATLFDQLAFRPVPENVLIKGQDGVATANWVGESKAIPVTTADFFDVTLTALEVDALAVISKKLIRESSPDAEMMVRDSLVEASSQLVDQTFFSAAAAVAGIKPAGILNGLTAIAASGATAAALRADIKAAYAPFIAARNAKGLQIVMNPSLAKSIQLMVNALGQEEFNDIGTEGGTLLGDKAWTGDNISATNLILLKPSDIYRIGDRGVQVSLSDQATVEMSSAPTGASDTPVAASQMIVSMYQTNSVAIKVTRPLSWAKRRASAVSYISGAAYSA